MSSVYLIFNDRLQGWLIERGSGVTLESLLDTYPTYQSLALPRHNIVDRFIYQEQRHPEGPLITLFDFFNQDDVAFAVAKKKLAYLEPLRVHHRRVTLQPKPSTYPVVKPESLFDV